MTDAYAPLRALLADAGYGFVDPPILYDASVFVEPLGEDLRRRLFLTLDQDGTEMALRPDFTIPVALHHLATGAAKRKAGYAYLGPVFRQRAAEPDEFLQAGVESLGRTDRDQADADILRLAFDAAAALGVARPIVRTGDSALFAAVLDALALSPPWQRRLARAFGDPRRLRALIARAADGTPVAASDDAGLASASPAQVRRRVEEMFAAAGLGVAGRTPREVADRYAEKATLAAGIGGRGAEVLERFLAIGGPAAKAAAALRDLARDERLGIGEAIDRFEQRLAAFSAHGIAPEKLVFAADFGRRLDYYTGFVFEMLAAKKAPRPLIGGGRYDRLVSLLARLRHQTAVTVPAVGFSIWLDRAGGAA
ncbi:MAG: ATP phosphoribosyltransferase regulatory subunit [Rhizobiales bacterium]|nr:ATP phosphoribosyltransferase regulatory subunit [Hyphomicrobiales bacterium]